MPSIDWLWTCGGECFGYRQDDALFTYEGKQVGRFAEGDEVYGREGQYLGELRRADRLITNLTKKKWNRAGFSPKSGSRYGPTGNLSPNEVRPGYEDFPSPKQLI